MFFFVILVFLCFCKAVYGNFSFLILHSQFAHVFGGFFTIVQQHVRIRLLYTLFADCKS